MCYGVRSETGVQLDVATVVEQRELHSDFWSDVMKKIFVAPPYLAMGGVLAVWLGLVPLLAHGQPVDQCISVQATGDWQARYTNSCNHALCYRPIARSLTGGTDLYGAPGGQFALLLGRGFVALGPNDSHVVMFENPGLVGGQWRYEVQNVQACP